MTGRLHQLAPGLSISQSVIEICGSSVRHFWFLVGVNFPGLVCLLNETTALVSVVSSLTAVIFAMISYYYTLPSIVSSSKIID